MPSRALLLCLGFAALSLPAAPVQLVLQHGTHDYAGTADTFVSKATWATPPQATLNQGQSSQLFLSRDGGDNLLLRFDLSAIPAHSTIVSATLELYHTTPNPHGLARSLEVYRVLKPWSEGNQTGAPITTAGRFGATGEYAVQFFPGEGTSVAWGTVGLAADVDYALPGVSKTNVAQPGWHAWDITPLVTSWVRGAAPNHGLMLRDLTGYQLNNPDQRTFHSSQFSPDTTLRPRLVIVHNPDTPLADAGADVARYDWQPGESLPLDASGSADHPAGNTAALTYAWRLTQAAYGSSFAVGDLVATGANASFVPDVAGDWEFELTVTNAQGESALDRVRARLWTIATGRPRLYLTPQKLAALQARAAANDPRWQLVLSNANAASGEMRNKALAYLVTAQTHYADQAIAAALSRLADANNNSTKAADLALIYDWCHPRLTPEQRTQFLTWFEAWIAVPNKLYDEPGWGNYWPRWSLSWALTGLALWGDSPGALAALTKFRDDRWIGIDVPLHDRIADGGNWPEGTIYDWIANYPKVLSMAAWKNATGEDLFRSTPWFRERFGTLLMQTWPGVTHEYGRPYRTYPSVGDAERFRHSIQNYARIIGLVLGEQFSDAPHAPELQAYLAALPTNTVLNFVAADEFIWFDAARVSAPPVTRTVHAQGTGTVFMRSGWPQGALDNDPGTTHLQFQSGDHFSYHQHFDQNSFTLWKGGDLLIDSGVYSGEGLSFHDVDYYVRTIAHNTLVVYNPTENFSSARPDAQLNDGGQRTFFPASRSPTTIAYYEADYNSYRRGKITRFVDSPEFTYVVGDATRAYNSALYHQAQDTLLAGNTAKVTRFVREFLYLRDPDLPGASTDEKVVLVDRVGVTQPQFSGANTKLLFHTLNEPAVAGAGTAISPGETLFSGASVAEATAGAGHLVFQFLHPQQRNVRKVGGRGEKSHWVFGTNVDWHWSPNEPQPRPRGDFDPQPYGEWRLELEPADDALDHVFLTVLHPRLQSDPAVQLATTVTGLGVIGARIPRMLRDEIVFFSSAADGSAPIGQIAFPLDRSRAAKLRLFNLAAGARYAVDFTDVAVVFTPAPDGALVATADGTLALDAPALSRLELTDLALLPDGRMQFTVAGTPDLAFELERSLDLVAWETIADGIVGAANAHYTEPENPPGERRFYRARSTSPQP